MKKYLSLLFTLFYVSAFAQNEAGRLTVEKIMRDPKWIGTSPSNPQWSVDGNYLFFKWNPDNALSDSTYYISLADHSPKKAGADFINKIILEDDIKYNSKRTAFTYSKNGDIFYKEIASGKEIQITRTNDTETNPVFSFSDRKIVYTLSQNLYAWDIAAGFITQLTDFEKGNAPPKNKRDSSNQQDSWLKNQQLDLFNVLKERHDKKEKADSITAAFAKPKKTKIIYIGEKTVRSLSISPDGRFVFYNLFQPAKNKSTIILQFVTESGYTEEQNGRPKVGEQNGSYEPYVFDTKNDTAIAFKREQIPGIKDIPEYRKNYPSKDSSSKSRTIIFRSPYWNEQGTHAVVDISSFDNKDRWLMLLDGQNGKLKLLDRQHDSAWIGGPIRDAGWLDENNFWFQSEESGYAHLYKVNVVTGVKTFLTSGNYEIQSAKLSFDKKYFYITSNKQNPGEQQFYRLKTSGGDLEKITNVEGSNQVTVSPDESKLAILYSYSNKPWELYLQDNTTGKSAQQITTLAQTNEFKSYHWRVPELITFTAHDGEKVYARVYKPAQQNAANAGVIFVHGAGYLQNAHKWWSSYFREYMFNNLLADNGYTVMDIDYRGSAGYGRNWRTGIYRFMGGKDLTDNIDAAKYMVDNLNVNAKHIGLYGGSYGGFITLMAMFTLPNVFNSGAALRSVTDWAHYNHGYTSDILNEPFNDSIAYRKSSPIYYADGLKGHLLMCHGMVDANVEFQDIVRLTQRLIELKKDNWELAVYPVEDHGFVEPSSWTDEYKRIFKLFETYLK